MFLKKILQTFLIIVITSNFTLADVTLLEKDQKAPYTGILFPIDEAQKIRKDLIEKDYLKSINESLKRTELDLETKIQRKDQQITILLEQNDKLAVSAYKLQQSDNLIKIGIFVLGILTMYGAYQLSKQP